ncbi:MAG: FliH/SctL family protein [Sulfuritalea sp.]|nr:FliH/SctL family protein [Sulfuritalea sp.]
MFSPPPPPKSSRIAWKPWGLVNFNDTKGVSIDAKAAGKKASSTAVSSADHGDRNAAALAEARRQDGYQSGFDSGRIDGLKAGRETAEAEARQAAAHLAQAISRFDSGIADLEHAVADELLALAIEIARKVINQAIAVQPQVILGTIREALTHMPAQHAMIHLNVEDAVLVRSHAGEQLTRAGHRIHEDPQLGRGDVVIEAGGAHLDSRLTTRWQRVIATLDQDTPWLVADETETS